MGKYTQRLKLSTTITITRLEFILYDIQLKTILKYMSFLSNIIVDELIEISVPSKLNSSPPLWYSLRGTYVALKNIGGGVGAGGLSEW